MSQPIRAALASVILSLLLMGAVRAQTLTPASHSEILDAVAQNDAQVTVVNFWATWCVPCVEEFPDLMRLDAAYPDSTVDVLFVSVDFEDAKADAEAFLNEQGVEEDSFLKSEKSTPFVNGFHADWSGAVPATFLYDRSGTLLEFWEGKEDYAGLQAKVKGHVSR